MRLQLLHALRSLRRAPVYTFVTVSTLAIGIGATTGVLSVVDTVLLRALPYRSVSTLAMVIEQSDSTNQRTPSYLAFKDLREAIGGAVEGVAFVRGTQPMLQVDGSNERALTAWVSPGYFSLVGGDAILGRTFLADDERAGANRVAVLSFSAWQRTFNGDPAVVGRTVNVDSVPTTIVGVMPNGFTYPFTAQMWIPLAQIESSDAALQRRGMHVDSRTIVRIRTNADSARAATALSVVAARLAATYPDDAKGYTHIVLPPITIELIGDIKSTLSLVTGAALLVLLLGCVNVATLALVRASVAAREMAVRAALGASRRRLWSELLVERALLVLAGAGGGVLLAIAIVRFVRQSMVGSLPRAAELVVDGRSLAIATGISIVAALLAGIAPAWHASAMGLAERLHGGQRGAAGTRADSRIRSVLTALQFSLAVMLLVGAGLLVESFRKLQAVPLGYDVDHIAAVAITPPSNYARPTDAVALYDRLRDAIGAVPGVQRAAIVNHPPGASNVVSKLDFAGAVDDDSGDRRVVYRTVSSDYANAMGMSMAKGRWFSADDMRTPDAAGFVVNETLARKFWPNGNAIGQLVTLHRASSGREDLGQPISGNIIGIVKDVHSFGREALPVAEAFVPYTREVWPWITIVARANSPAAVAPGIRKAIAATDPNILVSTRNTTGGVEYATRNGSLSRREMALAMVSAFAAAALLLAATGLYGVVSYTVSQRMREMGIRIALGATRLDVMRLVLTGAVRTAAIGTAAGLVGALAGTRLLQSLLFNTAPIDFAAFATAPALLVIVALVASAIPAGRASRVPPTVAIRAE